MNNTITNELLDQELSTDEMKNISGDVFNFTVSVSQNKIKDGRIKNKFYLTTLI